MTPRSLKMAQKRLGLGSSDMARLIGVPLTTYLNWKSGRTIIRPNYESQIEDLESHDSSYIEAKVARLKP